MAAPRLCRWLGSGQPSHPAAWTARGFSLRAVDSTRARPCGACEPGQAATDRAAVVVASDVPPAGPNAVRTYAPDLCGNGFLTFPPARSASGVGSVPNGRGVGPETDSDEDGMPDWWEILYGLDPNSPTDALAHADDNGVFNVDEYVADTCPTNGLSYLRVTRVWLTGGWACMAFVCSTARVYSLQTGMGFPTGVWSFVEGQTGVPGEASGTLVLCDTDLDVRQMYRIRVALP